MTADLKQAAQIALLALEYHTQQTRPITQTEEAIKVLMEALAAHCAQAPAEGYGMLKPLIYAAMMHNGKPKTVAEFERAAANVADMLQRRAEVTHNKPVASIYISDDGSREFDDWRVDLPPGNHQLFTAPRPDQPQPESLPHPGAPEAEEMIEKLLAECNRPSNMKNAAWARSQAPAPAPSAARLTQDGKLHVTAWQCHGCGHRGIDDGDDAAEACSDCNWRGPCPDEDVCPGCGREGTMVSACPKCGDRYYITAEADIVIPTAAQAPAVAHQPETALSADNTAFLKLQQIIGEAGSIKGYWPGDSDRVELVVKLANEVIDLLMQRPASGDITHAEYIALTNPGALKPLEVGFGPQETKPPVQGSGS